MNRSGQGGSRVDSGRAWPWPADGGEMEVEWPEMPTAPRREGKGEGNRLSAQYRVYRERYKGSGIGEKTKREYQQ